MAADEDSKSFRLLKRTRQTTEYSCGPSALQSVLSYWGKEVDETELMKLLHTTAEEGTYPDDIARGGLPALQDLARKLHGRDFLQLSEADQVDLLKVTGKLELGTDVRKFFDLTRNEAIRGYYTSAQGLEDLDYKGNAYYTESPGCKEKS